MKKRRKKKKGGLKMALTASGQPVLIGYKEWLKKKQEQDGSLAENASGSDYPGACGVYQAIVLLVRQRLKFINEFIEDHKVDFSDPETANVALDRVKEDIKRALETIDRLEDKGVRQNVFKSNWLSR